MTIFLLSKKKQKTCGQKVWHIDIIFVMFATSIVDSCCF